MKTKTKRIKAWAILKDNLVVVDEIVIPSIRRTGDIQVLAVFKSKPRAEEMTFGPDKRIIPITISYSLPKNSKSSKAI